MSEQTKYKTLISVIKSGLVGALAFTVINFIWVIILIFKGSSGFAVVDHFMNSPKFDFAIEALIVIVCLGFMLGVLLRRYFPIIQRKVYLLFVFYFLVVMSVIAVAPLGFTIWLFHEMWMGTELPPASLKLADCTNNVMDIHLKIPVGHGYRLDLKTPEPSASYKFSGHLRILSEGAPIADLPIGSDTAWRNDSWYGLTGEGMQNTNVPPLSKFIQSHKNYDFEISFETPPPMGSSIWLHCTRYVRDQ